ncbi:TPA: lysophospholipid acyltransferase family protein [Neisseria gonorrhoeae]
MFRLQFRLFPPLRTAMHILLTALLKCLSLLSLSCLHTLGNRLGHLAFYLLKEDRARIVANMRQAGLNPDTQTVKAVFAETAKCGLELAPAFFKKPEDIETMFKAVHGWEHVQQALDKGEGLLFITPHIGSYDLGGRYISQQLPFHLTAMYKPPKIKAIDKIMQAGRVRGKGKTAPTGIQGVKQIIKGLRAGEATIILPDHVPSPQEGGGVWADFFGKPAYTMTLAAKLAHVKGVKTLFFCCERLPDGQGFVLHIRPVQGELNGNKAHDAAVFNRNTEYWIRRFPTQYLFMYNRYKTP